MLAPFHFYAFPATYLIVFLYVRDDRRRGGGRSRAMPRSSSPRSSSPCRSSSDAVVRQGTSVRSASCSAGARRASPTARRRWPSSTRPTSGSRSRWRCRRADRRDGCRVAGSWSPGLLAMFLVPNLVVVSSVEFDMNKYFQIMWIPVAILAAWLIHRWPRPLIAGVLVVSAMSPALIAVWHVRSSVVALTHPRNGLPMDRGVDTPEGRHLRDRRVHQQSGRPGRAPADLDVRALCLEPGLRPGPARGGHKVGVLRRTGDRRATHGRIRRDIRALERRGPLRSGAPSTAFVRARCSKRSTPPTASASGDCATRTLGRISPSARRRSSLPGSCR